MGKFTKGDRVVIKTTSYYYGMSDSNPKNDIQGTVESVSGSGVSVKWDNGRSNGYGEEDLEFVSGSTTKFVKGSIVVISTSSTHYNTGSSNPPNSITGVIDNITATSGYMYYVKWSNGNSNTYREEDLVFAHKIEKESTSLKKGDRVVISRSSGYYGLSTSNPTDDVQGTIDSEPGRDSVYVRWDNGTTNGYGKKDLILVSSKPKESSPKYPDKVGTWYIYSRWSKGSIAKLREYSASMFKYSEAYTTGGGKDTMSSWSHMGDWHEATREEKIKLLPKDHPDNPEYTPSFIVGEWYTSSEWAKGSIAKFKEFKSGSVFYFDEAYINGSDCSSSRSWHSDPKNIREATREEVSKWLPKDHKENPNYEAKVIPNFYRIKTRAEMIYDGILDSTNAYPGDWASQMVTEGYYGMIVPSEYHEKIYNLSTSEESTTIRNKADSNTWWVRKNQFTTRREIYAFDDVSTNPCKEIPLPESSSDFDYDEMEALHSLDKMSEEKSFKMTFSDPYPPLLIYTPKKQKTKVILLPYKKRAII